MKLLLASQGFLTDEIAQEVESIGGRIDFIDLKRFSKSEIRDRISQADLIYFVGGKQNIVARIIREYNLRDIIDEMLNTKVVMGTSAGAIMWGKQIESKDYFKERYNKSVDDIKDKDYGIVNFNIIPHYLRKGREQWNEEFLKRTLKDEKFPVYAINDNQMISYVDGEINFIGGNPSVFGSFA